MRDMRRKTYIVSYPSALLLSFKIKFNSNTDTIEVSFSLLLKYKDKAWKCYNVYLLKIC